MRGRTVHLRLRPDDALLGARDRQTAHESAYALDGLLHHEADIYPTRHTSDTAGYTDAVFGLTTLFSIFFAPRIKDLPDQRLFYWDKADRKTCANIGSLLAAKVNIGVIKSQWDKLIELAAAIEQGFAPASRVLRKLQAASEHSDLYRALQELGRLRKTVYLLRFVSGPDLWREVGRQLNKHEHYHSLADTLFWGQKGELRLRGLEEQLTRASCLRLLAGIVILFNAAYLQAAVTRLREAGQRVAEDQLARIYPTATVPVRFLGDYSFRDEPDLRTRIDDLPVSEPLPERLNFIGM